ncbi:MAG: amino acid ABC transporter permease [Solobacterium sp.]|nr:amino acid ABC transporter permease [Solobacterium sp.]
MARLSVDILLEYLPLFAQGALVTLKISAAGIILSLLVGLVCCYVQYYRVPVLRQIAKGYIELSRNTPMLVQLFFIYFGLPKIGLSWSREVCAIAALVFLGGSYMAEAMRSGLEAVDVIQTESAVSLGMNRFQVMRFVVFPQAMAIALPAISANVVFLIKETSVVSAIALADLMYVAKDLIGNDYNTSEALFMLVVFYLLILLPVSLLASYAERRIRYAGYGA